MSGSSPQDDWLYPAFRRRLAQALLEASEPLSGAALGEQLGTPAPNVNRHLVELAAEQLVTKRFLDPDETPSIGRPSRFWILDDRQRELAERSLRNPPATPRRRPASGTASDARRVGASRQPQRATGPRHETSPESAGTPVSRPQRNEELVIADVGGPRAADLMAVLAQGEQAAKASWTALCGDELVFAFGGVDPVPAALRMLTFLHKAEVPVRRATVSKVWPPGRFPN